MNRPKLSDSQQKALLRLATSEKLRCTNRTSASSIHFATAGSLELLGLARMRLLPGPGWNGWEASISGEGKIEAAKLWAAGVRP